MVTIDLDLEGVDALEQHLEELQDRFDGDAIWVSGTNEEYGIILEMGRGPIEAPEGSAIPIETEDGTIFRQRVSGHPPYPWFRPAIREFKANPEQFIRDTTEFDSIDAIPTTNALVEAVATGLANRMQDNVNAQDASADRSPGTDPLHPRRDTGTLTNSIKAIRIR